MKLAIILPGEIAAEGWEPLENEINRIVSPSTEAALFDIKGGELRVAADVDLTTPAAVKIAVDAEENGFDAIVLNAAWDFALSAVRGAVNIPVVGAGMATYHLVYQLARRYAVISVNEDFSPAFLRVIREAGCYDRMTSMRSIGKPFALPLGGFYTPEELEEEFFKIGKKQVEEEKAQVIVIACTIISLFLKPGARERLTKKLGVIVPDLQEIAINTAEMLVNLGLSHSKREYPQLPN